MALMQQLAAAEGRTEQAPVTAVVILPDRIEHSREPIGLEMLQALVGGLIEVFEVHLPGLPTASGYVNEEGKFQQLDFNAIGTALLHRSGGHPSDWCAGTLVITGLPDDQGETQPVDQVWVEEFPEAEQL